jgi:glucose/arabinose dehydrogenase
MKKSLFQPIALLFYFSINLLLPACGSNDPVEKETSYFDSIPEPGEIVRSEKLNYSVDTVVNGLENPWAMAFLPNGEMLITERSGEIRIVSGGKLLDETIQGVPEVHAKGQGGLLDIELHPDFRENNVLYISYSNPGDGGANTAVMKAVLQDHTLTQQEVIFQATPNSTKGQHYGSRIVFDDKGLMYVSVGERGTKENAQLLENHSGKVHRLRDDGSIPSDNPFVDEPGAMASIFSYGNRNIQGMAVHPGTGEVWSHEHGPMGGDEINIIEAGNNYGWPVITYGKNYDGSVITDETSRPGMEQPLHYWDPSIAPCGMAFVTTDKYAGWQGDLLVGSLKFRYVARCELQDNKVVHEEKLIENLGRVRAIEVAPDGYIYVATESPGMVVRLLPQQ